MVLDPDFGYLGASQPMLFCKNAIANQNVLFKRPHLFLKYIFIAKLDYKKYDFSFLS